MIFKLRNYELIKDREKTYLTAAVAASATTLTVKSTGLVAAGTSSSVWANNDYMIIGEIGSENAEVMQMAAAVTSATSLTIDREGQSGGTRYAHSINEPVYRVDYSGVEFSRTTTETGAKSCLTVIPLQPDGEFTRYEDATNSTGYGFVRFVKPNTAATFACGTGGDNFSSYSDAIPYTGYTAKSLGRMVKMVRRHLNLKRFNPSDLEYISDEDITEELNEAQRDVAHERLWSFYEDTFSASIVAYQRDYSISSSCVLGKTPTIKVDSEPLAKIGVTRFDLLHFDTNTTGDPTHFLIWNNKIRLYPLPVTAATSTTLNGAISSTTATSITLTSISGFRAPGRVLIDSEVISYEYIDSTNVQLKGCQRGLEGTTAATHSDAATVTERDIICNANAEPTELVDIQDETAVPDPATLVYKADMELAMNKLGDQVLHDRYKIKYEQALEKLRDKFGAKGNLTYGRIKDKSEVITDTGGLVDPNLYPTDLSA